MLICIVMDFDLMIICNLKGGLIENLLFMSEFYLGYFSKIDKCKFASSTSTSKILNLQSLLLFCRKRRKDVVSLRLVFFSFSILHCRVKEQLMHVYWMLQCFLSAGRMFLSIFHYHFVKRQ